MFKNPGKILAAAGILLASGLSGWTQEKPPAQADKESHVQGEISFERALALVEKNEKKFKTRVKTLEWTAKSFHIKRSEPDGKIVPAPMDPNLNEVVTTIYEPSSGKYRWQQVGTGQWVQGADPYLSGVRISVFDGETEMWFERLRPGKVLPKEEERGRGVIKEIKDRSVSEETHLLGYIGHFPPNCYIGNLSDILKLKNKAQEIYSIKIDKDLLVIKMSANHKILKKEEFQVIYYNGSKGVVVKVEGEGKPDIKGPWAGKAYRRVTWEYQELEKGLFLPTSVIEHNFIDSSGSLHSFSNILINKTYKEDPFQFAFPEGTRFPP